MRKAEMATRTKVLSAIGSRRAPRRVVCWRRASQPSSTSVSEAAPMRATRAGVCSMARKAAASGKREADSRFGTVSRRWRGTLQVTREPRVVASTFGSTYIEPFANNCEPFGRSHSSSEHVLHSRVASIAPHLRLALAGRARKDRGAVREAELGFGRLHLPRGGAGEPAIHHRGGRRADQPPDSRRRRGGARGAQAWRALRRDGGVRQERAVDGRDLARRHDRADDLALGVRDAARVQPRSRVQGAVGGGADAERAAAFDERVVEVVPRAVDVLAMSGKEAAGGGAFTHVIADLTWVAAHALRDATSLTGLLLSLIHISE